MNLLESPFFREIGGWLAFLSVGGLFIRSDFQEHRSRRQQVSFLLALIGLLFLKRLPILFINQELNPNERQRLSQTITLWYYPISCYYAALLGYFGIPLNYIVLRWIAFFCVSVVSSYFAIEFF